MRFVETDGGMLNDSFVKNCGKNVVTLVATSDNIALLYHIALKAKTVRDAESHSYSEVSLHSGYGSWVPVTQDAL